VADSRALDALAHEMARQTRLSYAEARSALDELRRDGLVAVEAGVVLLPVRCPPARPASISVAIWGALAAALPSRAGVI
jgi:hypothetical protein